MESALNVAKYIISYCFEQKKPISNLKLQKMLYYAWIEYYKKENKKLFDDVICAWQFGPVVPEVYYAFCSFAGIPIARSYDVELSVDKNTIDDIINKYLPMSARALVDKSHKSGGAWDVTYKNGAGLRNEITFQKIIDLECNNEN